MCDDFRQQLCSNGCVQCAVSRFTVELSREGGRSRKRSSTKLPCAVLFVSDRFMTSTSMFGPRTSAYIFIPHGGRTPSSLVEGVPFAARQVLGKKLWLRRRTPRELLLHGGAMCAELESPDWHLTGSELLPAADQGGLLI